MARAPARSQARACGALGLQANLFGRLIRVIRSYGNAFGAYSLASAAPGFVGAVYLPLHAVCGSSVLCAD